MPEDPRELRAWLERLGLADADVLAVLDNAELDRLDPDQRRMLHGLLEARWQLDHSESPEPE
jgi:hypothetical protein